MHVMSRTRHRRWSSLPRHSSACWTEGLLSPVIGKRWATRQDLSLRRPHSDHRPGQSPSRQTVGVALATFHKRHFTAN